MGRKARFAARTENASVGYVPGVAARVRLTMSAATAIAQKLWDFGIDKSIIEALIATRPERTTEVDPPVIIRCTSIASREGNRRPHAVTRRIERGRYRSHSSVASTCFTTL